MSAYDISRFSFDPRKHYSSVRMQQGRVLTDDDWNENERIEQEELRRTNAEVIGPFGSPNEGFKIENLRAEEGQLDFDILPGSLYLGGLRLEMEANEGEDFYYPETFRTQSDWLQMDLEAFPVPQPGELEEDRFDLVYLEAWQQGVSAVEDEELFETALGGPDTTTRIRTMRRVRLAPDIGFSDCHEAWGTLHTQWELDNLGIMDVDHERVPMVRLQVTYNDAGEGEDLCSPSIEGGYLGAENQAIRVQIVDEEHFTWGFDNGAPLYRIEAAGEQVTMLTLPKDQHHWPLAGQVVEILPWSAVLPNGEKVAEIQGHLTRVLTSYDPDDHAFTLADPLPEDFGLNWGDRSDSDILDFVGEVPRYYLRVWNRGAGDSSAPAIEISEGSSVALGSTGISVTFTGPDFVAGDHWVVAVRPETRDQVVPWVLEESAEPHGIRRFFAPLAIIRWTATGRRVQGEVIRDCRKTFRPLTDLESCCTFHVGDGITSHGDFDSIEEAVQNLPEAGGQVCVLPGEHFANLELIGRHNIRIHGCGERSIVAPYPDLAEAPIISIASCSHITIDNLQFATTSGTAILLEDPEEAETPSFGIYIHNNDILAFEYGIYLQVDDKARGQNDIHIAYNRIAVIDHAEGMNGIFCLADQVLIERNKIVVVPPPSPDDPEDPRNEGDNPGGVFDPCDDKKGFYTGSFAWAGYLGSFLKYATLVNLAPKAVTFQSLGGIQIGGGSEEVRILDNEIIGGSSNGVTLGHIPAMERVDVILRAERLSAEDATANARISKGTSRLSSSSKASYLGTRDTSGKIDNSRAANLTASKQGFLSFDDLAENIQDLLASQFQSFLYEVSIEGNRIRSMGLSGIGVIAFFDPKSKGAGLIVQAENLTIYRNFISNCALQVPEEIPNELAYKMGFGGIALSSCEYAMIEENRIENNGLSYIDPISGIFILNGEDVEISRNRILNNGQRTSLTGDNLGLTAQARRGSRGGIVIGMSFKRQFTEAVLEELLSDGVPAAKIHDNIVVQPLGHALYLQAFGPVSVVGNQFTAHEIDLGHPLSMVAGAVLVINLGMSKDLLRMSVVPALGMLANLDLKEAKNSRVVAAIQLAIALLQYLPSGSVIFANNQTTLDLRNLEIDLTLASQMIVSLDDISFTGNQSECKGLAFLNTNTSQLQPIDLVLFNTALAGVTVRTADNRFQEGFTAVGYSLFSLGVLNTTTGNQASNCFLTMGTREAYAHNLEGFLGTRNCGDEIDEIGSVAGIGSTAPNTQVTYANNNSFYAVRG